MSEQNSLPATRDKVLEQALTDIGLIALSGAACGTGYVFWTPEARYVLVEYAKKLRLSEEKLRETLLRLRNFEHLTCEDPWYSCPKSPEGCCNDSQTECTCVVGTIHEIIDEALTGVKHEDN